jgi:hypothetical protein
MQKISRCSGYLLLNGAKWDIFLANNSQPFKKQDTLFMDSDADLADLFISKGH